MNLAQLVEISKKLPGSINPGTHLTKVLDSHGFDNLQQPASEFFYEILNQETSFFDAKNMPQTWTFRSLSGVMESLRTIVIAPEVEAHLKEEMGMDDYASLLKLIDNKRRGYMSEAKKQSRTHQKTDETTASEQPLAQVPEPVSAPVPSAYDNGTEVSHQSAPEYPPGGHIEKSLWILDKYVEGEKDEFKLIVLELLRVELVAIKNSLVISK